MKVDTVNEKFEFDSFDEFLTYATTVQNQGSKSYRRTGKQWNMPDWFGSDANTYEESLKWATQGWPNGRREMRAIADKLDIAGKVHRQVVVHDVVGDCWDMGKVMSGEPECAFVMENIEEDRDHGTILKLVVNIGFSWSIDESVIRARGAAILALVEGLEIAGKRLEIWALFAGATSPDLRVKLKGSDEPMQDDLIAFALAHPSMSRRFGLLAIGHGNFVPGTPAGLDSDIYVPGAVFGESQWSSPETSIKWVEGILNTYGIEFEAEKV